MDASVTVQLIVILVLAGFVGYYVVSGVTPALHTPLMAVTNAISGVVVVAGILVAGAALMDGGLAAYLPVSEVDETGLWIGRILGFLGVVLASINIFGGFAITLRMLSMYKPKKVEPQKQEDAA